MAASFVTWIIQFCTGSYKGNSQTKFCAVCGGFDGFFSFGVPITLDILRYKNVTTVISGREIIDYSIVKAIQLSGKHANKH